MKEYSKQLESLNSASQIDQLKAIAYQHDLDRLAREWNENSPAFLSARYLAQDSMVLFEKLLQPAPILHSRTLSRINNY